MFNVGGGMVPPPKANKPPIGIFWDIENCAVPRGICVGPVIHHIRKAFVLNRHQEYEFQIACDVTKLKKDTQEDIQRAGCVTLAHVNNSFKNSADEQLREAMRKFVDTHSSNSPTLILISGDMDFVNDLRGYQTRRGCHVILLYGPSCSVQFRQGWNEVYEFQKFCNQASSAVGSAGDLPKVASSPVLNVVKPNGNGKSDNGKDSSCNGKQRNYCGSKSETKSSSSAVKSTQLQGKQPHQNKLQGKRLITKSTGNLSRVGANSLYSSPAASGSERGSCSSELNNLSTAGMQRSSGSEKPKEHILMVSGLPGKMDYKILREQLQNQANEVKGFVKYVKNGQGFITFIKKSDADRAIKLFNGYELFNKTLRVSFVERIPFEERRPNWTPKNELKKETIPEPKRAQSSVQKVEEAVDALNGFHRNQTHVNGKVRMQSPNIPKGLTNPNNLKQHGFAKTSTVPPVSRPPPATNTPRATPRQTLLSTNVVADSGQVQRPSTNYSTVSGPTARPSSNFPLNEATPNPIQRQPPTPAEVATAAIKLFSAMNDSKKDQLKKPQTKPKGDCCIQ